MLSDDKELNSATRKEKVFKYSSQKRRLFTY